MGMVDISEKPVVRRQAIASGRIILTASTLEKIRAGQIKKGDPFQVAEVAAMNAAKQTHLLIPHCHQIPLEKVNLLFSIGENFVEAECHVMTHAKTGVEMEALVGVSLALNTIWDMVKYLEKDKLGQYPLTSITGIKVEMKEKSAIQ